MIWLTVLNFLKARPAMIASGLAAAAAFWMGMWVEHRLEAEARLDLSLKVSRLEAARADANGAVVAVQSDLLSQALVRLEDRERRQAGRDSALSTFLEDMIDADAVACPIGDHNADRLRRLARDLDGVRNPLGGAAPD